MDEQQNENNKIEYHLKAAREENESVSERECSTDVTAINENNDK